MKDVKVVLLSYRRPELTRTAIEELLRWPSLESLLVSVDGIRPEASRPEQSWWAETKAVAEGYSKKNDAVELNFRNENTGLTNHVVQALGMAFSTHANVILLEEDVGIESSGLDFLAQAVSGSNEPTGACAFTRSTHFGPLPSEFRSTYFPELWGMAINYSFFERFEQIWRDKRLDRELIARSMRVSFPSLANRRFEAQVDWWMALFESALTHPTHQDALFAATALELGTPWIVGWQSMAQDVAWGDDRGLHPRRRGDDKKFRHRPDLVGAFCKTCERKNGRLWMSSLPRRAYEGAYHSIRNTKVPS